MHSLFPVGWSGARRAVFDVDIVIAAAGLQGCKGRAGKGREGEEGGRMRTGKKVRMMGWTGVEVRNGVPWAKVRRGDTLGWE